MRPGHTKREDKVSTTNRLIVGGLLLAIVVEILITVAWYSDRSHLASVRIDPATALVVISAAAVGIERAIEYLWTAVEMKWGSFWPLSVIAAQAKALTDQLDESVDPYIVHAQAAVARLQSTGAMTEAEAEKLGSFLNSTDDQLQALKKSATGSQRIASYISAATAAVNSINAQFGGAIATVTTATPEEKLALAKCIVTADASLDARRRNPQKLAGQQLDDWAQSQGDAALAKVLPQDPGAQLTWADSYLKQTRFGEVATTGKIAGTALSGLSDFLATFKDNPGRRLLSIEIGIFAGILVAAVGGLDVIAGVQNQGVTDPTKLLPMTIGGIVFTGLVMGLGSSPTHEVIQTLQQYKEQRKLDAAPSASASAGTAKAEVEDLAGALMLRYR